MNQSPNNSVAERVSSWTEDRQQIYRSLANTITQVLPQDTVIKTAWAGVGFKVGSNWSCVVYPGKVGCNVMIYRGVALEDRFGVLDGNGVSTRNFRASNLDYNEPAFHDLLRQQLGLYAGGLRWE